MLLVPLLCSLSVHELAHARTALAFGDPTAKNMGRCTLNPLAHLDPIGTLAIIFCGFGWAKPVPVNPHNLHPRKLGNIAVSLAGPISNLMLALLACLALRGLLLTGIVSEATWDVILRPAFYLIAVNICLFAFNLLPLYPLDGHHVVRELLNPDDQVRFMQWQLRYGRHGLMMIIMMPFLSSYLNFELPSPIGYVLDHGMRLAAWVIFP